MYSNYQNSTRTPVRVGLEWNGYWPLFHVPGEMSEFYETLRQRIYSIDSERLNQSGFYMLLTGEPVDERQFNINELLYIGQAYDQTLRVRIPQQHPAYDCIVKKYKGKFLYLAVCSIISLQGISGITHELFDDIECCLIYRNGPLCNINCRDEYNSNRRRREIQIENTGKYDPLEQNSRCQ